MNRGELIAKLEAYGGCDAADSACRERFLKFVREEPRCFERTRTPGHITGSAWVVDRARDRVILTLHKKLGRWLQLGGHADGEEDVLVVARREAREESGLERVTPLSEEIFDIDIHEIPAFGPELPHLHYDVRFIFTAEDDAPLKKTGESKAVSWVPVERIRDFSSERSILRMAEKHRRRFVV